jgi:hypothetical protein
VYVVKAAVVAAALYDVCQIEQCWWCFTATHIDQVALHVLADE